MVENQEWLSLSEGEEVVWWGQPRMWRILPAVGKSAFWALAFLAVAVVGPRFAPPSVPGIAVTGVGLVLAVASLRSGTMAYLRTRNVYYVLTTRNVYEKSGVWSTNVTRVGIEDVQNTRLAKDVLGNLFDYGTVAVSTAGSSGFDVAFTDLDDPETFRSELQQVVNERRSRPGGTAAGALDAGTVDRLLADARTMRETAERLESEVAA